MKLRNTFCVILLCNFLLVVPSKVSAYTIHSGSAAVPVIVPNAYISTPGTSTFLGPLANAPRTYQLLINESELVGAVGDAITSITWRLPASATSDWPLADVSFSNYDIYLSESVAPANRSLTFANNVVGLQKLVKSGALTMTANSFTFGGSPNEFGRVIAFDSSYLYTGGHLLIEIRHTGFSGTSRSVDAIGTSITGYGTLFSACWTGSYTGLSGSQGNFAVSSIGLGGIVGISDPSEIPMQYMLSQNYPNPFNPVTRIIYSLPVRSFVNLEIYDMSGREVAGLVNEALDPGNHSVIFNADQLPSGSYFYKIIAQPDNEPAANAFVMTRKMILVK